MAMQLSSTEVELSCLSGCTPSTHPVYVWLKNGQKTNQVTARYRDSLQPGDRMSCAIRGHELYSSPAVCELTTLSFLSRFAFFLQFSSFFLFVLQTLHSFPL